MQLTDSAALILYAKPDFISNTSASVKVHINTDSFMVQLIWEGMMIAS